MKQERSGLYPYSEWICGDPDPAGFTILSLFKIQTKYWWIFSTLSLRLFCIEWVVVCQSWIPFPLPFSPFPPLLLPLPPLPSPPFCKEWRVKKLSCPDMVILKHLVLKQSSFFQLAFLWFLLISPCFIHCCPSDSAMVFMQESKNRPGTINSWHFLVFFSVLRIRDVYAGSRSEMFMPDPGSEIFHRGPRIQGQKDPGSGSASII